MIDCSKAYDGQSAFRNGIHDAIRLPTEKSLYRSGALNKLMWKLGNVVGRLPLIHAVVRT